MPRNLREVSPWIWFLVVAGTLGAVLTVYFYLPQAPPKAPPYVRRDHAALLSIAAAQEDFRVNDRDGNGVQDYWRKDVAGLYALVQAGPLKLIELATAGADAAAKTPISSFTTPGPRAGYLYRTLRFADEDPSNPDPKRFAAQVYPAIAASGTFMFIVSHAGVVWKKEAVPGGLEVFPADPAAEGWVRVQ